MLKKILKSNKGLTLVELIIGMVVLAIILATVSGIVIPMMQMQARANELAEQNAILDDMANQIIHDLSMTVPPSGTSKETTIRNLLKTLENHGDTLTIPVGERAGIEITYRLDIENGIGILKRSQAGQTGVIFENPILPGEEHRRSRNQRAISVEKIELTQKENPEAPEIKTIWLNLTLTSNNTKFTREYAITPLGVN